MTPDDQVCSPAFDLPFAETLSARTLSCGGVANSQGVAVAAGGFALVLSLFASTGELLQVVAGSSNGCGTGVGAPDPVNGFCRDVGLRAALSAGSYRLVLTQDDKLPFGPLLSDGFSKTGIPDCTGRDYLGLPGALFVKTGRCC